MVSRVQLDLADLGIIAEPFWNLAEVQGDSATQATCSDPPGKSWSATWLDEFAIRIRFYTLQPRMLPLVHSCLPDETCKGATECNARAKKEDKMVTQTDA